jgi:hypothetical protein
MTRETAKKAVDLLNQIRTIEELIKRTDQSNWKPELGCGMSYEVIDDIEKIWLDSYEVKLNGLKSFLLKKNNELKNLK